MGLITHLEGTKHTMAKKPQNTETPSETETPATPAEGTATETPATDAIPTHVEYGGFRHEIAAFSVKALCYLAQYGWAKSLQDSVAGRKKELAEEIVKDAEGKPVLDTEGKTSLKYDEAGVAAILKTEMGERAAAIIAGTVGTRGPGKPKATTREGMILKVSREWLTAAAQKAGKKLPKIGEGYEALLEKFQTAKKDLIEAEADKRMASAAEQGGDFDF